MCEKGENTFIDIDVTPLTLEALRADAVSMEALGAWSTLWVADFYGCAGFTVRLQLKSLVAAALKVQSL